MIEVVGRAAVAVKGMVLDLHDKILGGISTYHWVSQS
jgi:hypothetical protein